MNRTIFIILFLSLLIASCRNEDKTNAILNSVGVRQINEALEPYGIKLANVDRPLDSLTEEELQTVIDQLQPEIEFQQKLNEKANEMKRYWEYFDNVVMDSVWNLPVYDRDIFHMQRGDAAGFREFIINEYPHNHVRYDRLYEIAVWFENEYQNNKGKYYRNPADKFKFLPLPPNDLLKAYYDAAYADYNPKMETGYPSRRPDQTNEEYELMRDSMKAARVLMHSKRIK